MEAAFDPARAEAFAGRMMSLLNDAFLGLLVSIGHETGLFDRMATLPPADSAAIAAAAGLHERQVREWLGGMVVGGLVEFDAATGAYRLPAEHAAFLTRTAGMGNLAFYTRYLALLGSVEEDVIRSFREGGGVGYDRYPAFQKLQAEDHARLYDNQLVDAVVPLVAGLRQRLESGIDVLDLGSGQGRALNLLAKAFPRSRFLGLDNAAEGVQVARCEAEAWGLANAKYQVHDLAAGFPGSYDLVLAFDVIHDLPRPDPVLASVVRALRPEGVLLMMDIAASSHLESNRAHPAGPLLYTSSTMHCMQVSLAQGGEGLGCVWGQEEARTRLDRAGFRSVEMHQLPGDAVHAIYVARP